MKKRGRRGDVQEGRSDGEVNGLEFAKELDFQGRRLSFLLAS
jgi:hypothetical protein